NPSPRPRSPLASVAASVLLVGTVHTGSGPCASGNLPCAVNRSRLLTFRPGANRLDDETLNVRYRYHRFLRQRPVVRRAILRGEGAGGEGSSQQVTCITGASGYLLVEQKIRPRHTTIGLLNPSRTTGGKQPPKAEGEDRRRGFRTSALLDHQRRAAHAAAGH